MPTNFDWEDLQRFANLGASARDASDAFREVSATMVIYE